MPRLVGTSVEDVLQVLGTARRPLSANAIHARVQQYHRAVTGTTIYRSLQVLRRWGVVHIVPVADRRARDARMEAILKTPGHALTDAGAMRFCISDSMRAPIRFAVRLEKFASASPPSRGRAVRREFYRWLFHSSGYRTGPT